MSDTSAASTAAIPPDTRSMTSTPQLPSISPSHSSSSSSSSSTSTPLSPSKNAPHPIYSFERRHFPDKYNKQTEQVEKPIRARVEPKFSSPDDRPRGKLQIPEDIALASSKSLAELQESRRGKHVNASVAAAMYRPISEAETRSFPLGGKGGMANRLKALQECKEETSLDQQCGRIHRLSESELHARNEHPGEKGVEYRVGFYKFGACVPAVVDMSRSRGAKTLFGFEVKDLKSQRVSGKLWKENRTKRMDVDPSKLKTYKQVAAERELAYEQQLVAELPDEIRPPEEEVIVEPVEETPTPVQVEDKKGKSRKQKPLAARA